MGTVNDDVITEYFNSNPALYDEYREKYYSNDLRVMVILSRLTGLLSFLGSSYIVQNLIIQNPQKLNRMFNMLILGLSIADCLSSFFTHILNTVMVPRGLAYGAIGTITSCTIQGLMTQFGIALSLCYSVALSLSYVLTVRFRWTEEKLQKFKLYFLLLPLVVSIAIALPALIQKDYNYRGNWACHIAPSPLGCDTTLSEFDAVSGEDYLPCVRGRNSRRIYTYSASVPLVILNLMIFINVFFLYFTVLRVEQQLTQSNTPSTTADMNNSSSLQIQSSMVRTQGLLYVGAFILSFSIWYVVFFFRIAGRNPPGWVLCTMSFLLPLQGVFNVLIYERINLWSWLKNCTRRRRERRFDDNDDSSSDIDLEIDVANMPNLLSDQAHLPRVTDDTASTVLQDADGYTIVSSVRNDVDDDQNGIDETIIEEEVVEVEEINEAGGTEIENEQDDCDNESNNE